MSLPGNSEFTHKFFDEASEAWRQNKVRCGHIFLYKCKYIHSNQKQCKSAATHQNLCKKHYILLKSRSRALKGLCGV